MGPQERSRIRIFAIAALCPAVLLLAASTPLKSQSPPAQTGSLAGRLTNLHSAPLAGVSVVLRNVATGRELRTTTGKNGAYRFASLQAGEYALEAESPELGRGSLDGIVVSSGHESRVESAIDLEIPSSAPVLAQATTPATPSPAPAETPTPVTRPPANPPPVVAAPAPVVPATAASAHASNAMPSQPTASVESPPRVAKPPSPAPESPVPSAGAAVPPAMPPPTLPQQPQHPAPVPQVASLAPPAASLSASSIAPALRAATPAVSPALAMGLAAATAAQAVLFSHPPQLAPVLAAAQQASPAAPAVSTTVSAAEIQSLPATGRNWQQFLLDTPASTAAAGASQPSFRGASQQSADVTVDGLSTRLAFGTGALAEPRTQDSGSYPQSSAQPSSLGVSQGSTFAGGRGFSVSEAGIREVQTIAGNVEAEGATAAGGRINIETARGTPQFHGQGFLFDRQNTWGARNPFTQWITETAPAVLTFNSSGPPLSVPTFDNGLNGKPESYTPPDHETVWGIGLGSPIRPDKLFWFAALDSYHRNDPGLATVRHPYLLETVSGCTIGPCTQTTGFFEMPTDCQLVTLSARLGFTGPPSDCVSGLVQGLTAYSTMLESLAGLLGPAPRSAAQWVGFARIDWQAAERHRFTLEGIGADWNSPGGGLTGVSKTYGNHSFGSSDASQQWLLARWEAYLTPNLLATTQASAGRDILGAHPDTPSTLEQTFLQGSVWGQLPQIVVDSRYGFTIGNPSRFGQGSYPDEHLWHAQEALDWVRNRLLFKAGIEVDHNADSTSLLRNQTGTYYYSKVEDFISDALVFEEFGLADPLDYANPHNCGATDTTLGAMPCYSYYSQTMGPTNWQLSTSDWSGFVTTQWQTGKAAVFSAGLRWDREQLPPPLAALANPELPLTGHLPSPGNNWGPRFSLALGSPESRWPVLRLGYGMYYGRTQNATLETALTQTGSPKGDLSYFLRPTDDCQFCAGGSPPFPYVFAGPPASVVKPGAVEFAPTFRNPEVHQAVASIESNLPAHILVTAAALASFARRLPVSIDTNFDPTVNPGSITYGVVDGTGAGPIKAAQITVPFYASWPTPTGTAGRLNPDYQQISEIFSRANSTYEAAMVKLTRYGRRGLTFHAHYTYAHAMDWNPNETTLVAGSDVLDPRDFNLEYGTSDLDVRHSAAAMVIYQSPWKLSGLAGRLANGWMLSGVGQFRSGLPYTMRTSGSLAEEFDQSTGAAIVGLAPGMNGSGGDNRVYGMGSDGRSYSIGRNTFRYPHTWKADLRLGKRFGLGHMRSLELMAESFNLFNHQNVTEIETTGYYLEPGSETSVPTLNFLTGLEPNTTAFGKPLNINATDFYRERQIEVGLRMQF